MQLIINILLSYFIGSISGSMVFGKLKGIDIRAMGSGNAGGTNAFRSVGPLFALGVVLIDISKGIIAVLFISPLIFIDLLPINTELVKILWQEAESLQLPAFKNWLGYAVYDDHVPLWTNAKIPAVDIIDF